MGHYQSLTPKRHVCWSNSPKVGALNKGRLLNETRKAMAESTVKSATTKVRHDGKKTFSGTRYLRETG